KRSPPRQWLFHFLHGHKHRRSTGAFDCRLPCPARIIQTLPRRKWIRSRQELALGLWCGGARYDRRSDRLPAEPSPAGKCRPPNHQSTKEREADLIASTVDQV